MTTYVPIHYRRLLLALTLLAAVSAIAGSVELFVFPNGNTFVPVGLLESTPFQTFVIPGMLLGFVVGGANAVAAFLLWRRAAMAIDFALLGGGALCAWIASDLALMRQFGWLHVAYGGLGVLTLGLAIDAAFRSGVHRHRWVVLVTVAEAVGFLFPTVAGCWSERSGFSEVGQAALLVVAGLFEGYFLGTGQAEAFGIPLGRGRYAVLTAVGAAMVWACVMSVMLLGEVGAPIESKIIAGVCLAAVGLLAIGSMQWLELRKHAPHAGRWIGWTALAWAVALPFSFAPGPLVDDQTPVGSLIVLWACGGTLMAYVMALVTWQGCSAVLADRDESRLSESREQPGEGLA